MSLFAPDTEVYQYADDTQLLVSGTRLCLPNVISTLESALVSLDQWFRANALKVNTDKTQIIAIGSRPNMRKLQSIDIRFGNTTVKPCLSVKNLGVTFDHLLTWDSHVSMLSKRCFGTLAALCQIRHHVPRPVIKVLVTALVLSQLRYCISVFGNGSKKNMNRLQKIINFAAKVIYGRRKYDHVSDLLSELGWMSCQQLYSYHSLCLLQKVIRSGEPAALANAICTHASLRERHTRQDDLLFCATIAN